MSECCCCHSLPDFPNITTITLHDHIDNIAYKYFLIIFTFCRLGETVEHLLEGTKAFLLHIFFGMLSSKSALTPPRNLLSHLVFVTFWVQTQNLKLVKS